MDEAWKKARRDELWDAYVHNVPEVDLPAGASGRTVQAFEMLHVLSIVHQAAVDAGDIDQAIHTAARGRIVWQLLTHEFVPWLFDEPLPDRRLSQPDDWAGCERIALSVVLAMHRDLGPHPHRPAIDPVPVLIPRWLLDRLAGALEALGDGEVQDIVRPAMAGRHGTAWSW